MNAQLIYGDSLLAVDAFHHLPAEAREGNPYNTSFKLHVRSGGFAGVAPCEYDIAELRRLLSALGELYRFERASAELNEICYGSRVRFEMEKTGHLTVSGELFGERLAHRLAFSFCADQTALQPFIRELRALLETVGEVE